MASAQDPTPKRLAAQLHDTETPCHSLSGHRTQRTPPPGRGRGPTREDVPTHAVAGPVDGAPVRELLRGGPGKQVGFRRGHQLCRPGHTRGPEVVSGDPAAPARQRQVRQRVAALSRLGAVPHCARRNCGSAAHVAEAGQRPGPPARRRPCPERSREPAALRCHLRADHHQPGVGLRLAASERGRDRTRRFAARERRLSTGDARPAQRERQASARARGHRGHRPSLGQRHSIVRVKFRSDVGTPGSVVGTRKPSSHAAERREPQGREHRRRVRRPAQRRSHRCKPVAHTWARSGPDQRATLASTARRSPPQSGVLQTTRSSTKPAWSPQR